ncbi:mCG1048800, partial [Mus musculus]
VPNLTSFGDEQQCGSVSEKPKEISDQLGPFQEKLHSLAVVASELKSSRS